jgi:hypothetical protein
MRQPDAHNLPKISCAATQNAVGLDASPFCKINGARMFGVPEAKL